MSQQKLPVILVHGIWDTGRVFRRMRARLEAAGHQTFAIDLQPSDGSIGVEEMAEQLCKFIDASLGTEAKFHLIGFSMGGMVSRYYLQRLGGLGRVDKFIAIASPHNGTLFAYLLQNPVARQFRPRSAFLRDLNRDRELLADKSYTFGTLFDLMIVPFPSARLFKDRHFWYPVPVHAFMIIDKRVIEKIVEILN